MRPLFLLSFFFILVKASFAQDTSFIIDAGAKLNDVIPVKVQYLYPEFLKGKVFYRDGGYSAGKLNFNRLLDEMHFIKESGDTLALDNEGTVKFICFDKDTFYFDKGFVMLLKGNNEIKLAVKHGFRSVDLKMKNAGYDMMSSTSSISSIGTYDDGMSSRKLIAKGKMQLSKAVQYYFGDKYGHFTLATRKNLIELFPRCTQLNQFIQSNNINFSEKDDLEKVVNFLEKPCQ